MATLMPSSYADSIPPIIKLIIDTNPHHVLDVGPGWGKYGLMCREYLPELETLDAVEVPEGRLPIQDAIYDHVSVGDVRDYTDWAGHDLVLLIDVIEHLSLHDGHAVVRNAQRAGCPILVSTPQVFIPQYSATNPHESHLSLWQWEDFSRHGVSRDCSTVDSIIYLLPGHV